MSGFNVARQSNINMSNTVKPAKSSIDYSQFLDRTAALVMVDTVGLALDFASIDLPNAIVRVSDVDGDAGQRRQWAKHWLRGASGRQTIALATKPVTVKKSLLVPDGPTRHTQLRLEGSVAAHFQGHNIVSSADVPMLAYQVFKAVSLDKALSVPTARKLAIARGLDAEVTRMDVVVLLRVPKGLNKAGVINAIGVAAAKSGLQMSLSPNESVYFGQHSQYCAGKLYDKVLQLAGKGRRAAEHVSDALIELAETTIRMEFVFRKKYFRNHPELKGKKAHPLWFTRERLAAMLLEQLERIFVEGRLPRRLDKCDLMQIPLKYRHTVAHWQNGQSVKDFFNSDRTLRQHVSFIRDNYNIDVLGPTPDSIDAGVDLMDLISPANFVPIPGEIRADKRAFFEEDMKPIIERLRRNVGSGISAAFVDPYRSE